MRRWRRQHSSNNPLEPKYDVNTSEIDLKDKQNRSRFISNTSTIAHVPQTIHAPLLGQVDVANSVRQIDRQRWPNRAPACGSPLTLKLERTRHFVPNSPCSSPDQIKGYYTWWWLVCCDKLACNKNKEGCCSSPNAEINSYCQPVGKQSRRSTPE